MPYSSRRRYSRAEDDSRPVSPYSYFDRSMGGRRGSPVSLISRTSVVDLNARPTQHTTVVPRNQTRYTSTVYSTSRKPVPDRSYQGHRKSVSLATHESDLLLQPNLGVDALHRHGAVKARKDSLGPAGSLAPSRTGRGRAEEQDMAFFSQYEGTPEGMMPSRAKTGRVGSSKARPTSMYADPRHGAEEYPLFLERESGRRPVNSVNTPFDSSSPAPVSVKAPRPQRPNQASRFVDAVDKQGFNDFRSVPAPAQGSQPKEAQKKPVTYEESFAKRMLRRVSDPAKKKLRRAFIDSSG